MSYKYKPRAGNLRRCPICRRDFSSKNFKQDFCSRCTKLRLTKHQKAHAFIPERIEGYSQYLTTDIWKEKARLAKARALFRCQVCYSPYNIQTHHRTYMRLYAELESDLTVLCDECHDLFSKQGRLYKD